MGSTPHSSPVLPTLIRWTTVVLVLAAQGVIAESAAAQTPSWTESILGEENERGDSAETPTIAELQTEREAIDAEIESLRAVVEAGEPPKDRADGPADGADGGDRDETDLAGDADPITSAEASRLRVLEKTRSLLGQQIDELKRTESLAQAQDDLAALRRDGVAVLVDHEPPFGFDDLDSVLSRLEASRSRHQILDDTVAAGVEALDEAEKRFRQAEQDRRLARERVESAAAEGRAVAEAALDDLRKAARLAAEGVSQLRMQLVNDRRELELVQQREVFLESGTEWIRSRLKPSGEAVQARLDRLLADQSGLRDELTNLRGAAQREEARLLRAQNEERAPDAEASRTALDLLDQRQRLLEERIDRRDLQAELWRARARIAASPPPDAAIRRDTLSLIERDLAELERDHRLLGSRLQDLRAAEARVADRLLENPSAPEAPSLRRRQTLLQEQTAFVEAQLGDIEEALILARRAKSEAATEGLDAGELATGLWKRVVGVWQWSITVVEDRPITLGKVILALLLLIAGYMASKRISQAFGRVLQQRFGVSSGGAAALQSIAFYLMVIAFLLWAMQLVSIPLTVFTLLGGVLAIGIGFGSQNVVNNFISGLILLVERPVKVGDLIEVDGTVGSVERIGLRSARVRSGDNTHIIVPNSTFLEQKVLNWTVTDDLVRTQVDVGIAYGSPTREAERLMKRALDDEPLVVQNMPKEVHFLEFGDNALLFRAYFWIRVRVPLDKLRAGSSIRFRIDELFADAGIVIAFPQRDVHLDTLSPLQVRLLGRPDDPDSPGQT